MPTETLEIKHVYSKPARSGATFFEVSAVRLSGEPRWATFSTFNELKASLCQRAIELGVFALVRWEPGEVFHDKLVSVHLLPEKVKVA